MVQWVPGYIFTLSVCAFTSRAQPGVLCVLGRAHPKAHRNPSVSVRMHLNSIYLQCSCWEKPNQILWCVLRSCSQQPCDKKSQHLQGLLSCGAGAPPTWSLQTKQMTKNSSLQMWNSTKSLSCTLFSHYLSSLIPCCIPCLLPLQAQLRIKRRCLSLGKMFKKKLQLFLAH